MDLHETTHFVFVLIQGYASHIIIRKAEHKTQNLRYIGQYT